MHFLGQRRYMIVFVLGDGPDPNVPMPQTWGNAFVTLPADLTEDILQRAKNTLQMQLQRVVVITNIIQLAQPQEPTMDLNMVRRETVVPGRD